MLIQCTHRIKKLNHLYHSYHRPNCSVVVNVVVVVVLNPIRIFVSPSKLFCCRRCCCSEPNTYSTVMALPYNNQLLRLLNGMMMMFEGNKSSTIPSFPSVNTTIGALPTPHSDVTMDGNLVPDDDEWYNAINPTDHAWMHL
jgi:hypothetical protein